MTGSIREDDRLSDAIQTADEHFRAGFAALAESMIGETDKAALDERVKAKMREKRLRDPQGNPGAIRDFVKAAGWIQTPYMEALFEVLTIPNASQFAAAYDALHKAVDGRSEPWYRQRNGKSR